MQDWHKPEWLHNGIADVEKLPSGALMRTPYPPYVQALRRWQRRLSRVTALDEDPFDNPVDLAAIERVAREIGAAGDIDWH
jgi:hypothetical protein